MPSLNRVLGFAFGGAVLGGIVFRLLTPLVYNFFFPGGTEKMGDQMIPIILVTASIGSMIGAAAGAAWALPPAEPREGG